MLAILRHGIPISASTLIRSVRVPTTSRMAVAAPLPPAPLSRTFVASARRFDAWTDHKDVTYDELKSFTEQPTGVCPFPCGVEQSADPVSRKSL